DDGERRTRVVPGAGGRVADERLRDWRAVRRHSARRRVRGADQRKPGAERETGVNHAGGDAGLVYRDWFLQPDAGVGAGGDVSGDFWLAERGQLSFTVHPDPDPDAGRDARAH